MQITVPPQHPPNRARLLVGGALAHAIIVAVWWFADDRELTRELWTGFGWAWLFWLIALGRDWKRLPPMEYGAFVLGVGVISGFGGLILWNTAAAIRAIAQ